MTTLLQLDGVVAGYGTSTVLHGIDVRVDAGEVVALLGANGAGKSTLLKVACGFVPARSGEVSTLGAAPLNPVAVARRGVSYVPEQRCLFADMTVEENLRLGARSPRSERKERIEAALDFFPILRPLMKRRAGLLSGGEQQMLVLARSLTSRPRLMLIDEMSQGLAPIIVERLLPLVQQFARELQYGVLLVEQHVDLALDTADRAYVLARGRVALSGPTSALQSNRDLLQQSYLGHRVSEDTSTLVVGAPRVTEKGYP